MTADAAPLDGVPVDGVPVELAATPFSRRGSFFAVSIPDGESTPGVFLRTVRGGARNREILRLIVGGESLPAVDVESGRVGLAANGSRAEIALEGPGRALLRVVSGAVDLEFCVRGAYDVVLTEREDAWRFVDSGAVRNYRIRLLSGRAELDTGWDVEHTTHGTLKVAADAGPALLAIDEYDSTPPDDASVDFDGAVAAAADDFAGWWSTHGAPTIADDPGHEPAARLACFVTWSALLPPTGLLGRESMLMSKNRMAHVWSWDHCFNAMALRRDPGAAFDQLMTIFDHQDAHGGLPDHIDDAGVQFNFAKPPIHGWAVSWLLDRGGLTDAQLTELEGPLARWTDWWREHRDLRGDGIPSYQHGNDSGWDNSTVFGEGVPVQSADLLALLALQERALERIAERLGRPADAARRRASAASTIAVLLAEFWDGQRFVARHTATGAPIRSDSLLTLMPLALGELLPPEVFASAVATLEHGGYLTAHGVATEPPSSRHYVADGYWRGPSWAPTVMLLVDGLRRGGRDDLADRIATAFIETCAAGGMAENFDALTGAPLRDRSMTWTASVLLVLLGERGRAGEQDSLGNP